MAATDARSVTSTAYQLAEPPISVATASAAGPSRSVTTTIAPWAAVTRAMARPMPAPAPVTMVTLSCKRIGWVLSVGTGQGAKSRPSRWREMTSLET